MNELELLYTECEKHLTGLGYQNRSGDNIPIEQLRQKEFLLNRAVPGKSKLRFDIATLGYYGFTLVELKMTREDADKAMASQLQRYTSEFAKYNGEIPKVHAYGVMWFEDGKLKSRIQNWKTGEPTDFEDLIKSGIGLPIVNTQQWLINLRQGFWRGQSFAYIDETLQKLLFAKYFAESKNLPFHIGNFLHVYKSARADYYADTNVDMGDLPASLINDSYAYRDTIEAIQRVQISSDPNIWHLINHLWTEKSLRKEDGQYFTPYAIKRFMCSIYRPAYEDIICDPCGGSGGFIIMAADMLDEIKPGRFYYYDSDGEKIVKVATRAFATYKHPKTGESLAAVKVRTHDSLDVTWDCKMDRIYTNVPFGHKVPATAVGKDGQNILKNYDVGRSKRSELSQLLFIEKCINQLEDGGTFATVVDKGIVTNRKYTADRAILAKKAALELIVELPGVAFEHFAGTTFPTYLLFFRKTAPTFTRYEKVKNIGYSGTSYRIRDENAGPFDACLEEINYENCDLAEIEQRWRDRDWPANPDPNHDYVYSTTETGNWLWGHWKYQNVNSRRLRDIAQLVITNWNGENDYNPTVDRRFRYVKETHLSPMPKSKTRMLKEGCLLMSRLLSDDQSPACGVISEKYHGAGCTNENYIIQVDDEQSLITVWFLINFDEACHDYLWSHCRGQGRGRITDNDLLNMPVRDLTIEEMTKASDLLNNLKKKIRVDEIIEQKLAVII